MRTTPHGPIFATRKALERAGLTVQDLDLVELNEAFASQSLECIKQLELEEEIVNVNGGAIAFGPYRSSFSIRRHSIRTTTFAGWEAYRKNFARGILLKKVRLPQQLKKKRK